MSEADDAPKRVIVIGAGPAGLSSAIALAQAGFAVDLYDPRWPTPSKACGEGLMPSGVQALQRLGISLSTQDAWPLSGVAFVDGNARAEGRVARAQGVIVGVRRERLSALLRERALRMGVRCHAARVDHVSSYAEDVRFVVNGQTQRADWAVAADGLHSPLRKAIGLAALHNKARRYGQRRHYTGAPWSRCIEVYLTKTGEAYVTPVSANSINIAILTSERGKSFDELLGAYPAVQEKLVGMSAEDKARGAGPLWQQTHACVAGRLAFVGDAAGYVDAITGEGVSLALASSILLADTLQAGRPLKVYAKKRAPLFRHYAWHARLLLLLARAPIVRRLVVRLLQRVPLLFDWWLTRSVALDWRRRLEFDAVFDEARPVTEQRRA